MDGPASVEAQRGGISTMLSLALLSCAVFTAASVEFMPAALLTPMAKGLGVSESRVGLLLTAFAFTVAGAALPLARLTTRWDRRPLFAAALLVHALGDFTTALAESFATALIGRAVQGLSHAVLLSIVPAMAMRLVSAERLGRAVAVLWTGTAVATVVGVPLGGWAGVQGEWRTVYAVLGALAAMLSFLSMVALPDMNAASPATALERRRHRGPLIFIGVTTSCILLGNFILFSYIDVGLAQVGFAPSSLASVLLLHGLAGVVGLAWAAWTVDRFPRAALVSSLTVLTIGLAGFKCWPLASVLLWGLGYGALATYLNAAALRATGGSTDLASVVVNATFNLGVGCGAVVGSILLSTYGLESLNRVAAGVLLVGLALVLVGKNVGFPRHHLGPETTSISNK